VTEWWDFSVFLVTVHDPICTDHGDLEAAFYGSFLPVPSLDSFPITDPTLNHRDNLPGAIIAKKELIAINPGREKIKIKVTNNSDRPIQVSLQVDMLCRDAHQHRSAHTITLPKRTKH